MQARYPQTVRPMAGHSAFLQKRLAKGQKYFDSGDYQMAKQTGKVSLQFFVNSLKRKLFVICSITENVFLVTGKAKDNAAHLVFGPVGDPDP